MKSIFNFEIDAFEAYSEFDDFEVGQPNVFSESDDSTQSQSWDLLQELEWESTGGISSKDYIRWVQRSLNRILNVKLSVDGKDSSAYRAAVRSFNGKYVRIKLLDDKVDEKTQNALIYANEQILAYMFWAQEALLRTGALADLGVV